MEIQFYGVKKILSILLAVCFLMSLTVPAVNAEHEVNNGFAAQEVNNGFAVIEVNNGFAVIEINNGFAGFEVNNGFVATEARNGFIVIISVVKSVNW